MKYDVMMALICVAVLSGACRDQKGFYDTDARERLFQTYLNGTADEARASLKRELQSIKSDAVLSESGKAGQLFITYTRWYWLEKRSGQNDAALKLLERARRWNVARFELDGVSKKEAKTRAEGLDPASMGDKIEKLDRSANNGNPPHFYSTIKEK